MLSSTRSLRRNTITAINTNDNKNSIPHSKNDNFTNKINNNYISSHLK